MGEQVGSEAGELHIPQCEPMSEEEDTAMDGMSMDVDEEVMVHTDQQVP